MPFYNWVLAARKPRAPHTAPASGARLQRSPTEGGGDQEGLREQDTSPLQPP